MPSLTTGRLFPLPLLLAFANVIILGFKPYGTHDHILLSQISDSPNFEGQIPVFTSISPRNRLVQLQVHLQALGFLHHTESVEVEVTLRLTVSQYVLVSSTLVGLAT
jgi:hypothetical protein